MAELSHLSPEDRQLARHLLELGQRALEAGGEIYGDFLDPHQREMAAVELAVLPGLRCLFYGGYRKAERQRIVLSPDYLLQEAIDPHLAFLELRPGEAAGLTHQDYLGAVLGAGLKREKFGDVLVISNGCQLVVAAEIAGYLQGNLARIGRTSLRVAEIEPEQLQVPVEREKEIRTTVASLRLDAVAADGFGASRTRMAQEIKAGRVRVNWQPALNPDKLVQAGDVISSRGRGRVVVAELTGRTKKGRIGLILKRMI